jgi:hypothetical protein
MRKLLAAVIFSTVTISSAWASVSACPSTVGAASQSLDTINLAGGCELVDKQFSNFTSTPVGETSTIQMLNTSVPGTIAANSITGLQAAFNDAGLWHLSSNATTTSVFNYQGAVDQTFTAPTTGSWTLSQISLVVNFNPGNAAQIKNGDSITVRMEWCAGATTVTGCANLQFIEGVLTKNPSLTLTYTNSSGNTNNFLDVTAFNANSIYAVRNTLTFVGNANGSALSLGGIENGFDEIGVAPEPSTFVMFGIALTGLVALRFRRRKLA